MIMPERIAEFVKLVENQILGSGGVRGIYRKFPSRCFRSREWQ